MTNEQKRLSLQMRADGQTYIAIAETLRVPSSIIKSFCAKAQTPADDPAPVDMVSVNTSPENQATDAEHIAECPSAGEAIAPVTPARDVTLCRQCGEPLHLNSANHMKRFCSENCRQKWRRAHNGEQTSKASASVCMGCGMTFKNGGNPARRYCSQDCYFEHRFSIRRGANVK